jgi:hypothetical protein
MGTEIKLNYGLASYHWTGTGLLVYWMEHGRSLARVVSCVWFWLDGADERPDFAETWAVASPTRSRQVVAHASTEWQRRQLGFFLFNCRRLSYTVLSALLWPGTCLLGITVPITIWSLFAMVKVSHAVRQEPIQSPGRRWPPEQRRYARVRSTEALSTPCYYCSRSRTWWWIAINDRCDLELKECKNENVRLSKRMFGL